MSIDFDIQIASIKYNKEKNPEKYQEEYVRIREAYKMEVGRKTALYNKYLGLVAKDVGISKKITSHVARHSAALFTYKATKDLKLIQENLGHKDIRTTIRYIGRLNPDENDQILNSVFSQLYA